MKTKLFMWIFVLFLMVPISFGTTFCDSGNCCDGGVVVTARTLTTSYSCDKHSNNLLRTTVNCDGLSADSTISTTTYLACNSTQYCDDDGVTCMDGSEPFEDAWGFDELTSEEPNIFKASLAAWRLSADGSELALYFSWGFIPLLLAIMVGIRYKKVLPAGFVLLVSTGALMALDALPQDFSTIIVYYLVALILTITIAGVFGNK